jgi:hypothetical protein
MRMQRREQKKEQKSRAEQDQYQWKLKQVQAKKLREVPTSEYIAQRDPKSRDPDGLGEPLDDHYMPFVSDRMRSCVVCCAPTSILMELLNVVPYYAMPYRSPTRTLCRRSTACAPGASR